MKCSKCHAENRDDSKFCSNCAAPLGAGAGAGPDAGSLTKTLETPRPVSILKPGALIAGKDRIVEDFGPTVEKGPKNSPSKPLLSRDGLAGLKA